MTKERETEMADPYPTTPIRSVLVCLKKKRVIHLDLSDGVQEYHLPDVLFPAKLDQVFIYNPPEKNSDDWHDQVRTRGLGCWHTFYLVFPNVDEGWILGVHDVGCEVIDHGSESPRIASIGHVEVAGSWR